jgi:hypothetical protein
MTAWPTLAELPLRIESYAIDRLAQAFAYGRERVTSRVRLQGSGEEGHGEDVGVMPDDESNTLHEMERVLPLTGEWTLGGFCEHLRAIEQFDEDPPWGMMRRWRNWAFQSAALDLALRQASMPLHEAIGREPRPLRFVNSLGLGEPPTFDPIARRLEHHPGLRFKVDAVAAWTPELIDEVAATGAVEIIDFKGRYGMEVEDAGALLAMYERVIDAFPDALLEDGHEEALELLEPHADRLARRPRHAADRPGRAQHQAVPRR